MGSSFPALYRNPTTQLILSCPDLVMILCPGPGGGWRTRRASTATPPSSCTSAMVSLIQEPPVWMDKCYNASHQATSASWVTVTARWTWSHSSPGAGGCCWTTRTPTPRTTRTSAPATTTATIQTPSQVRSSTCLCSMLILTVENVSDSTESSDSESSDSSSDTEDSD